VQQLDTIVLLIALTLQIQSGKCCALAWWVSNQVVVSNASTLL